MLNFSPVFTDMFQLDGDDMTTSSTAIQPPIDLFVSPVALRHFCDLITHQDLHKPPARPTFADYADLLDIIRRFECPPSIVQRTEHFYKGTISDFPWDAFCYAANHDMVDVARQAILYLGSTTRPLNQSELSSSSSPRSSDYLVYTSISTSDMSALAWIAPGSIPP